MTMLENKSFWSEEDEGVCVMGVIRRCGFDVDVLV